LERGEVFGADGSAGGEVGVGHAEAALGFAEDVVVVIFERDAGHKERRERMEERGEWGQRFTGAPERAEA
jgi:hypothetical protein